MKYLRRTLLFLLMFISLSAVILIVSGKTYVFKTLIYTYVGIEDLDLFYTRRIDTGTPKEWPFSTSYNKKPMPAELRKELEDLKSVAFVVIKDDSLLFENYWENYSDSSLSNSFSMAKSIVGVLIGIAIDEGKIKSLDQKVGDFIPEFKTGSRNILTLRHLITMSAALNWDESYQSLFSPTTEAYYGTDLYKLVTKVEVNGNPGKEFNYQSACSELLGIVLQKATGTSLSNYASEKLWKPVNAMHAAEWSLDHKDGLEKSYCCFYSNARDFARIGSLYLHNGMWDGKQVVSAQWVHESVTPAFMHDGDKMNAVYGNHWWIGDFSGKHVFYCRGILGQYIVVIPDEKIVFVRLGHLRGEKKSDGTLTDMPLYVKGVMDWVQSMN